MNINQLNKTILFIFSYMYAIFMNPPKKRRQNINILYLVTILIFLSLSGSTEALQVDSAHPKRNQLPSARQNIQDVQSTTAL